jgi:hypothetical protein
VRLLTGETGLSVRRVRRTASWLPFIKDDLDRKMALALCPAFADRSQARQRQEILAGFREKNR